MLALEEGAGLAVLVGALILSMTEGQFARRPPLMRQQYTPQQQQAFRASFVLSFTSSMVVTAGSVLTAREGAAPRG